MSHREPAPFSRRRFLAAAVAAACGWASLPIARGTAVVPSPTMPGPIERPLAAADLYAPHDLAG